MNREWLFVLLLSIMFSSCDPGEKVSLKMESLSTLQVLTEALQRLQITDPRNPDFGALACPHCQVLHTRAAEAVYPFAVIYQQTGNKNYASSAIYLGNWLIRQQLSDGSWKETPEEWTGTTTDQLLMMVLAYQILKKDLSPEEQLAWQTAMTSAADYLTVVMEPAFASINYCATTTASLAMMDSFFPNKKWAQKAHQLAWQVAATMNEDGFICAEGDRVYDVKYGADVGYEIDMSLWGIGLYARLTHDTYIDSLVRYSLKNHLYFVYPNGAIDGSWGIRSNKWTTYGSQTADGCQILFGLFAKDDPRYRTAAMRNLHYLRTMLKDGLIGYGPHYWELFGTPPCIYPAFARSKNLAMTIELGEQEAGPTPPLPADETGWIKFFPSVDVALIRSRNFMATISAYQYKELKKRNESKYMHRPAGGAICNLWVEKYGFLQISSQTEYHRWEPMHFPKADSIACLTPRIEFSNENGYFTNLYEFDGKMTVSPDGISNKIVTTSGELTDKKLYPGGIAYTLTHTINDDAIEKSVALRYHGRFEPVRIVEPIVQQPGVTFELLNEKTALIKGEQRTFRFEIFAGPATIELGKAAEKYWAVFPSIKCCPIILNIPVPEERFMEQITYQIKIIK